MAKFAVEVKSVVIENHPNADRISIAQIEGTDYQSIVKKGDFEDGDLVAYIPEGSVVPDDILEEMGLKGQLAGSQGNRVKAVRLRGVLSQGLCYPALEDWEKGQDVTEELGVEKYVPPIPTNMGGDVYSLGSTYTIKYDLENYKNFPDVFEVGSEVIFTEKLHGTNFCAGFIAPDSAKEEYGPFIVHSKGLGSKGLPFKPHEDNKTKNLYMKAAYRNHLDEICEKEYERIGKPVFVLGEVLGIQDLDYSYNSSTDDIGLRIFDVHVGYQSDGHYLAYDELVEFCDRHDLTPVPELYRGPFSKEKMLEYTDGMERVSGEELHIREGIVIKPVEERRHIKLGRVILKSVSEDYLTRGNDDATEYN